MADIIQRYLSDTSIEESKRRRALEDLQAGKITKQQLEGLINQKYKSQGKAIATGQATAGGVKAPQERSFFDLSPGQKVAAEVLKGGFKGLGKAAIGAAEAGQEYVMKPLGGGIVKSASEALTGKEVRDEDLGVPKQILEAGREAIRPEGFLQKAGAFAGEMAPSIAAGGLATKALTGLPGLASKGGQLAALVGGGGVTTTGAAITGEGRLPTMKELGKGAAIDVGTLGLGKFLRGAGKGIAERIVPLARGRKGTLAQRGVDVAQSVIEEIGPTATRKGLVKKASKRIAEYGDELSEVLEQAKLRGRTMKAENLTKNLKQETSSLLDDFLKKSPESDVPRLREAIEEELRAVSKKIGRGKITPKRVNELKKYFDGKINYNRLDPITNVKAAVNKQVADNARNALSKMSPRIKELNSSMAPLIEMRNALTQKGPYSSYLTDIIALSGGAGARIGEGLGEGIGSGLKALALKKILTGTPAQTGLATGLFRGGQILDSPIARGLTRGTMFGRDQELQ